MSENDGIVSSSGETVQKSKLPVLLIILEIVGIILVIPYMLYNIPAVKEGVEELFKLGDSSQVIRLILMGIVIVIIIIAAILESSLRKKNMISKSVQKTSTTLNIILMILVIANLIMSFVFK